MFAKKENRVYKVTDLDKKTYLERGFDIVDEDGNIVEASPSKKISYSEHLKIVDELNSKITELESNSSGDDKELKKENKELKKAVDELNEQVSALIEENNSLKEELAKTSENGDSNGEVQK